MTKTMDQKKSESEKELSEKQKIEKQKLELWQKCEIQLVHNLNPEDLRTAGLLQIERKNWMSGLLRLEEAIQWGVRDMQVLDYFGEACYRCKMPQALIPFAHLYLHPRVAVHMARGFMMMGERQKAFDYCQIADETMLKKALLGFLEFQKDIEYSDQNFLQTYNSEMENLNLLEFWQALAPLAETLNNKFLYTLAETKLKAYAYDKPVTHFNQSLRMLNQIDQVSAGWKLYDWRISPGSPCEQPTDFFNVNMWEGQSLKNKTLLVVLENGFGDQIFSLRFVSEFHQMTQTSELHKNCKIVLAVRSEIFDLVQSSYPDLQIYQISELYSDQTLLQTIDYWIYAFSLPARAYLNSPCQMQGYLSANRNLQMQYEAELKHLNPQRYPIYALTWHGDIRTAPMRTRAYSAEEFFNLVKNEIGDEPCVIMILQKDMTDVEKKHLIEMCQKNHFVFYDASEKLTSFSSTAALIKNSTRVFSCDTAVAHLASGLGHPTTVFVRNTAIWHWLQNRDGSSFWNSSATIKKALHPKYSYMYDVPPEINYTKNPISDILKNDADEVI